MTSIRLNYIDTFSSFRKCIKTLICRSVITRPTDSSTGTTNGQTDTKSRQTNGQTSTKSRKTSTTTGEASTTSGLTSTTSG